MIDYSQRHELRPCILQLADIRSLFTLAIAGISTDASHSNDITISTEVDGKSVSENSIDDFLNHPELPAVAQVLLVEIRGRNAEHNIDKSINIYLYKNHGTLRVSGESEAWVLGKTQLLTAFLAKRRPFLWFVHTPFVQGIRGVLTLFYLAGALYLIFSFWQERKHLVVFSVATASLFVLEILLGKQKFVQVFFKDRSNLLQDTVPILTVIATIAAVVSAVAAVWPLVRLG